MRPSSLAPQSSIIVEAPTQEMKKMVLSEEVLKFNSEQEYVYHITHKVNNVVHDDGRIYLKIVDGILHANSVSPYCEKFEDNIEEKIWPLVKALKEKRYLTYSSCMGHDFSFRRYVGIAFADKESRQYVAEKIMDLKIHGVKVNYLDTVSNMKVTKNPRTNKPEFDKYSQEQLLEKIDFDKEAQTFNIQFHRNYERYYFLEIVILEALSYEFEGIFKEIEKFYWKMIKRFFWDKLTQKIVNCVNSKDFKKYSY